MAASTPNGQLRETIDTQPNGVMLRRFVMLSLIRTSLCTYDPIMNN